MNVSGLAPPLTEQAEDIDRIWDLFLLAGLVVGVGVLAVLLFVLIRFRRRGHDVAAPASGAHPDRGDLHRRAAARSSPDCSASRS